MLCAACDQMIPRSVQPHDGLHAEDCMRLTSETDWCYCNVQSTCPACCMLCKADACSPPPPLPPPPKASREPFAWANGGVAPAWSDEPPGEVVIPQAPLAGEEFAAAIAALPIGLMRWAWQKARSLA